MRGELFRNILTSNVSDDLNGASVSTQNVEALRNHVINQMNKQIAVKEMCMYCKGAINKIQLLKNRIIMVKRKSR